MAFNLVEILIGPITSLLDKVIPDKDAREKMAHEIAMTVENHAQEQLLKQLEINAAEAQHPSVWVAGWRPGAGWVCVAALASNYLITPYVNWGTALAGRPDVVLPVLDMSVMMPLLFGMLGLTWARTREKEKGVARTNFTSE